MKRKLINQTPSFKTLLFLFTLFFSIQVSADTYCGQIEDVLFTDGTTSVEINNGVTYNIGDLPNDFKLELDVNGYSQSARYTVENLDTGALYHKLENFQPYNFPGGSSPWNLGAGTFKVTAKLYKYNYGYGYVCDVKIITFTLDGSCEANAGTLSSDSITACLVNGTVTITATANNDANVPAGYAQAYVLTSGAGLVIEQLGGSPSFDVTQGGMYTIHSIVFDPNTLDVSIVQPGVTTGFDVNGLLIQGGGTICASLDVAGAPVMVEAPAAGTMTADSSTVQLNGTTTITATANGDANVPTGYAQAYVLTSGTGLVIEQLGATPSFDVTTAADYTIHSIVFDPNTLDVSIVQPGVTTGFDVFGLITEGGGAICASLDVAGAPITVESCEANAGTLSSDSTTACLVNGTATVTATANNDANVPAGYAQAYVLTSGAGLVIEQLGGSPSFDLIQGGMYTIHSIVFDPNTLDVSIVQPGVTTGFDINGLLIQGGGTICASLDVAGAPVMVEAPAAGTMTADSSTVQLNGTTTITATANGDANVPTGYAQAYVLTSGTGLVIEQLGATPSFDVTTAGDYTIHSIVFDPNTLDVSIVQPGVTTGFDIFGLITEGGGAICASLDVAGAPITVVESEECIAYSGTLTSGFPVSCLSGGVATIDASELISPNIPSGYQQLFVLTEAFTLTILNVSTTPEFYVNVQGFYRIHSLVYNPNTLDLNVVQFGVTTGFDVINLINDNGICASLDAQGAINLVINYNWFCYFFDYYNNYYGKSTSPSLEEYVKKYDNYRAFEKGFINENSEMILYPNPAITSLNANIILFDNEVMTYTVTDISGRTIVSNINLGIDNGKQTIDVSRLQNGMYIMTFKSEYRTITRKIQIAK